METIIELRNEINLINQEIIKLILKRNNISLKIGLEKRKLGLPIYDRDRENNIYTNLEAKYPENYKNLKPVFEEIIKQSRLLQN